MNRRFEIIAEIGQNHNGDMKLAKQMIELSKECGADVAKFQVFEAKTTFPPPEKNPWYDYNCKTELTRAQLRELAEYSSKVGIEFMASVFDVQRVDWLEEVGARRYKVASRSVKDQAILNRLSATGKPIIVSLGMWDGPGFPELKTKAAVDYLYCVSKYPTALSDLHFDRVDFKKYAGFSDHTIGLTAPMAAMARGARIIEKHFTIDKMMYGPDHEGSMDPKELAELVRFRNELEECL